MKEQTELTDALQANDPKPDPVVELSSTSKVTRQRFTPSMRPDVAQHLLLSRSGGRDHRAHAAWLLR